MPRTVRLSRVVQPRTSFPLNAPTSQIMFAQLSSLDPQARDRSADDQLLDLLGAFEDVVGLIEGVPSRPESAHEQRKLCPPLPRRDRARPAKLGMN